MDLLIPNPRNLKGKIDIAHQLKDLGFILGFTGSQGFIRLEHPELIVEFLVPQKGQPSRKPYSLPQLGLNAQALLYLDYLASNMITANVGPVYVNLPHPANFALHKLLIMDKRPNPEKREKDKDSAIRIMKALIHSRKGNDLKKSFQNMPQKWQSKVKKQLINISDQEVIDFWAL